LGSHPKKEREGAATLLYSMQIIIIVNITYYKTITYNDLIIGKLFLVMLLSLSISVREGFSMTM
jgi:hypothetical protein